MKSEKIASAFDSIQPDDVVRNRVFNMAIKRPRNKRPAFRAVVSCATAATLILLMVLGGILLAPASNNVFTIKAYALEQLPDGSIGLCEVDLINQPDTWGGYFDGEVFFISIGLKAEGDNIKSVEFSTTEGFFAKQDIGKLGSIDDMMPQIRIGNRLVMAGTDFDIVGDTITIDKDTIDDDYLIFWGTENADFYNPPQSANILAKVKFDDGKTAEETVFVDLSGESVYAGPLME